MAADANAQSLRVCPVCGHIDLAYVFEKAGYKLLRCEGCAVVFVANPPSAARLKDFYSFASGYHNEFYDDPTAIAGGFQAAARQFDAIRRHHPAPGRLLDVGASAGFFVKTAVDHGWDAVGIELSEDTARLARERQGVNVRSGRLEDADFAPASFDAITLWDVIEHLTGPADTLRRVAQLLRPGGILGVLTPNLDGLYPRASYRVGRWLHHWPAVEPPAHLFQFSTRSLRRLLAGTGFSVLSVEHECQALAYTFGTRDELRKSVKRLAYGAVFAPLASVGPRLRAGDEILVVATKAPT